MHFTMIHCGTSEMIQIKQLILCGSHMMRLEWITEWIRAYKSYSGSGIPQDQALSHIYHVYRLFVLIDVRFTVVSLCD